MNVIFRSVPPRLLTEALKAVQAFSLWHNTPNWDYQKRIIGKDFTVHETKTGTIVVNYKL
jgi:hypothetical protein